MTGGPKDWDSPAFLLVSQNIVRDQKNWESTALLLVFWQKCCTFQNTFVISLAEMLYCPKIFVVGNTTFYRTSQHFCRTVQKFLNINKKEPIPIVAKAPKTRNLPD